MDNASKGAMHAAEQYGAEQDEAEERARIADAHGLNVGEAYFMQLLLESNGLDQGLADCLIAVERAGEAHDEFMARERLADFIIHAGWAAREKAITAIMKANAEAAKRDEGDPS